MNTRDSEGGRSEMREREAKGVRLNCRLMRLRAGVRAL